MQLKLEPKLVAKMKGMIDPCDFRTVKAHVRHPDGEIQQAILLKGGLALEELAAFFAQSGADVPAAELEQLFDSGSIVVAVDDLRTVRPSSEHRVVLLDSIPDDRLCYVVYLPPFYLVQVTDKTYD